MTKPETKPDAAAAVDTAAAATTDTTAAAVAASATVVTEPAATTDTAAAAAAVTDAAKDAPVVTVVPDTYDLKLPDGSTLDPAIVERTAARARALGLSNEAGQQLLDQTVEDLTAHEAALTESFKAQQAAFAEAWKNGGTEFVKRDQQWRADALADAEIGGTPEKLAGAVEKAKQALTKYGPELSEYLDQTGLGSHPAAIKFLARIGNAMSEADLVVGSQTSATKPKSDAQLLYPDNYDADGKPKP